MRDSGRARPVCELAQMSRSGSRVGTTLPARARHKPQVDLTFRSSAAAASKLAAILSSISATQPSANATTRNVSPAVDSPGTAGKATRERREEGAAHKAARGRLACAQGSAAVSEWCEAAARCAGTAISSSRAFASARSMPAISVRLCLELPASPCLALVLLTRGRPVLQRFTR